MEKFDYQKLFKDLTTMYPTQWIYKTYAPPHAELCPVCQGKGKLPDTEMVAVKCHGCDGKGWITIESELKEDE